MTDHAVVSRRVSEQRLGYRKGMVLGLTLAEVALLLVFVLLMLLAIGFARRDRDLARFAEFAGKIPVEATEFERQKKAVAALTELNKFVGGDEQPLPDDFTTLVAEIREALGSTNAQASLVQAREDRKRSEAALKSLEAALRSEGEKEPDRVAREFATMVAVNANQQGQIRQLQTKLENAGMGRVLPSCWSAATGETDYLFDVVLTSKGLRVKERAPESRADERERLPVERMNPEETLIISSFLQRTRGVFDLSVRQNCRFFVVVYDATAEHEKDLYKSLLQAVENHFYKKVASGTSPF